MLNQKACEGFGLGAGVLVVVGYYGLRDLAMAMGWLELFRRPGFEAELAGLVKDSPFVFGALFQESREVLAQRLPLELSYFGRMLSLTEGWPFVGCGVALTPASRPDRELLTCDLWAAEERSAP